MIPDTFWKAGLVVRPASAEDTKKSDEKWGNHPKWCKKSMIIGCHLSGSAPAPALVPGTWAWWHRCDGRYIVFKLVMHPSRFIHSTHTCIKQARKWLQMEESTCTSLFTLVSSLHYLVTAVSQIKLIHRHTRHNFRSFLEFPVAGDWCYLKRLKLCSRWGTPIHSCCVDGKLVRFSLQSKEDVFQALSLAVSAMHFASFCLGFFLSIPW